MIQLTTIKKIKNNNWAPSKIRLRLGAEVDKNYNNSNHIKNTIFLNTEQLDWHLCCHDNGGEKEHRQAREKREKLRYIKSFVTLGPTGRLVLSANIKKYVLVLLSLKQFLV